MEDYKKIAQLKYLQKHKIKIDEELTLQKLLEEEQKKKDDEIKKQLEEEIKKQIYIQSQICIIDESILTFDNDKTDDNIMLIITNIISSLDNIITLLENTQKQNIINKIVDFTNQIDKMNASRPKSTNTIANVKVLSKGFMKIYELLGLDVEIITLDTERDEDIARNLARPSHLAGAANAAIERAKKLSFNSKSR